MTRPRKPGQPHKGWKDAARAARPVPSPTPKMTAGLVEALGGPNSVDNDTHPADGNGGKVATSGNVAMAADGDADAVTPAMIDAGVAELQQMRFGDSLRRTAECPAPAGTHGSG
jgi:hypothetical protein